MINNSLEFKFCYFANIILAEFQFGLSSDFHKTLQLLQSTIEKIKNSQIFQPMNLTILKRVAKLISCLSSNSSRASENKEQAWYVHLYTSHNASMMQCKKMR